MDSKARHIVASKLLLLGGMNIMLEDGAFQVLKKLDELQDKAYSTSRNLKRLSNKIDSLKLKFVLKEVSFYNSEISEKIKDLSNLIEANFHRFEHEEIVNIVKALDTREVIQHVKGKEFNLLYELMKLLVIILKIIF